MLIFSKDINKLETSLRLLKVVDLKNREALEGNHVGNIATFDIIFTTLKTKSIISQHDKLAQFPINNQVPALFFFIFSHILQNFTLAMYDSHAYENNKYVSRH